LRNIAIPNHTSYKIHRKTALYRTNRIEIQLLNNTTLHFAAYFTSF